MGLKDQIANDLDSVFLNLNDFAEEREIEGATVTCIVNEDSLAKVKQGRILGLVECDMMIFGKTTDLPPQKGPESIINVDGRECIVVAWANTMGMAEIALRQNRTM